jgi:methyl-accepting chemotaxis protein
MAGKGNVTVKIDGDASNYQKELNESVKATEQAAKKIDNAFKDAGKTLSDGLADSFKEVQKEQEAAVKSVGKSVHNIAGQNKEIISQKGELGTVYDALGNGAKNAAVKVKAGLADIKAGIDMAVTAAKALGEVASKGINYNATIEQMQTSFEVMTGSAEKAAEVVDRLRVMGAETPFETKDLTSVTQLLMQYGFTADDALDKMRMLGDVAQGNTQAMKNPHQLQALQNPNRPYH